MADSVIQHKSGNLFFFDFTSRLQFWRSIWHQLRFMSFAWFFLDLSITGPSNGKKDPSIQRIALFKAVGLLASQVAIKEVAARESFHKIPSYSHQKGYYSRLTLSI